MGYLSNIYIIEQLSGVTVARMEMDYMSDKPGWKALFTEPYEKGLYADLENMPLPEDSGYEVYCDGKKVDYLPGNRFYTDRFNQPITYARAEDVYAWCKENRKEANSFMVEVLYQTLKALIKGYKEKYNEQLYVVHFGH